MKHTSPKKLTKYLKGEDLVNRTFAYKLFHPRGILIVIQDQLCWEPNPPLNRIDRKVIEHCAKDPNSVAVCFFTSLSSKMSALVPMTKNQLANQVAGYWVDDWFFTTSLTAFFDSPNSVYASVTKSITDSLWGSFLSLFLIYGSFYHY